MAKKKTKKSVSKKDVEKQVEKVVEEKALVLENLTAITRAGADIILTYHLRDILKGGWLD